ncbi:MAG: hypothetical protein RIR26_2216 [Pseudomonadota bacterium]
MHNEHDLSQQTMGSRRERVLLFGRWRAEWSIQIEIHKSLPRDECAGQNIKKSNAAVRRRGKDGFIECQRTLLKIVDC